MPKYHPFSATDAGPTADSARAAEALQHDGDLNAAIRLLEGALAAGGDEADVTTSGWVYSRLATLYRRVGRLEDEVNLLERYCECHQEDEWRLRFNARLYKARTLLSRSREEQSPVRRSVRGVMQRVKAARPGRPCRWRSRDFVVSHATFIAWRFWWNCGPDRRGIALLIVVLWSGGLATILAH